ncbi:hypothetical protein [Ideonella sp.]|uniref:hypothetical protein n=1 Tax=Ideonella sp. TaxID=1929293 RepID=UPI0035B45417
MKFVIATAKPRNPLVAPSRMRRAGSHGIGTKAQRQQGRHELRRELRHAEAERHGP